MLKTDDSPTPGTQICKDKMKLVAANRYPDFQRKTKQEVRQEIEARLYRIFEKYA